MAISKDEIKKMTGQYTGERSTFYKLNEARMSGDDGTFSIVEILRDKAEDGKYPIVEVGKTLPIIILKMRWKLSKYIEGEPSINTTEYDNKFKDQVVVFPSKEKGVAVAMKEKYALSTQRVIYAYLPQRDEIVRLNVKASALSSEKNPNGELGLFDYIDEYNETDTMVHEFATECTGVFREGTNANGSKNKRKDHFAMSFKQGRALTETEIAKVETLIAEVHNKTANPNAVQEEPEHEAQDSGSDEAWDQAFGGPNAPAEESKVIE